MDLKIQSHRCRLWFNRIKGLFIKSFFTTSGLYKTKYDRHIKKRLPVLCSVLHPLTNRPM